MSRHAGKRIARDARHRRIESVLIGIMVVCWALAVLSALISVIARLTK